MSAYPAVLGEFETLKRVLAGESIARYGDGEIRMAEHNSSIKSQTADTELSRRLRGILQDSGACMVGIPNIYSDTPKGEYWRKFQKYAGLLNPDKAYVSSFITRPDSAPWIDAPEYWAMVPQLWQGRSVTLVRGSGKSLTAEDLVAGGAGEVTEVLAPRQHAWADYASLLKRIGRPERAILCLGPTATVMAVDLCARGVHAIDWGHGGMFWRKHLRGEPMWVTDAEKSVDRGAVA